MKIGSLCSGYGGLDQAVQAVFGGEMAWHSEVDKHANAVLLAHWPTVPNLGDLTKTDWGSVQRVHILTAGYPCQPFSHAGKRKGSSDVRHLWPPLGVAIGALRPRWVVLENVAGHVSLGLDVVLGDLAEMGYDATWCVVRASDVGAPHQRARLFILASDTNDDSARDGREGSDATDRGPEPAQLGSAPADARGERHGGWQDGRGMGRLDGENAGQALERQRSRAITGDRGATAAPDASSGPFAGPAAARDGLPVASECGDDPIADTDVWGREECPQLDGGAPQDAPYGYPRGRYLDGRPRPNWGPYAAAVARWEHVTGRIAPRPTEPGQSGERLNPRFVEWMMGLRDGHVTGVGVPRNAQLKILGNGVVPQQAELAIRTLLRLVAAA